MTTNKPIVFQNFRSATLRQAGLIILLLMIIPATVYGQDMETFYRKSMATNQTAMWLLGSWAVGNMVVGGVGLGKADGSARYFHQMNLMWNTVNLGIAAFGLLSQAPEFTSQASELIANHRKMENLFLINSGLDLLYIAGGAYMIHRSGSSEKRADLLKGYGQSVILQGGFLLVFDTAFWLIQRNLRMNQAWDMGISLMPGYSGMQLSVSF